MDPQTKAGKVYLQPHKAGKKWKPVWLSLFPPSSSGVGRLEIQDMGGGSAGDHGGGLKRHHQPPGDRKPKMVRLSELISVLRLPPNAEACPMENMAAFCVETQSRTMVFAALKDDCVEWVEKLCQNTFQRGAAGSGVNHLHMEENQIYATADEASEFRVVVQRTDAAVRCGLQGTYRLEVGQKALLLKDTMSVVREWPYELLRRYGRDKLALTIEAGRRCDSGPGTFTFETQQAERIFSLIQFTIKRKTSENQEGERVMASSLQAHSPLPKVLDLTSMAAALENSSSKDSSHLQEESSAPAPITLMPLPMVPTHSNSSQRLHHDQPEAVYADPADCVPPVLKAQETTAQYVDPAKVLPLLPPTSRESPTSNSSPANPSFTLSRPDSVYAEVYDKVSPGRGRPMEISGGGKCVRQEEPIYDEPMSGTGDASPREEPKPDPFAHLYAKVCKINPSPRPSPPCTPPLSTAAGTTFDPLPDDIIYENLGII